MFIQTCYLAPKIQIINPSPTTIFFKIFWHTVTKGKKRYCVSFSSLQNDLVRSFMFIQNVPRDSTETLKNRSLFIKIHLNIIL